MRTSLKHSLDSVKTREFFLLFVTEGCGFSACVKHIRARGTPSCDPCPCGYYGDLKRGCRCGVAVVLRYRQRISGPLLDRIDLHVDVPSVAYKELTTGDTGESSQMIRERVERCRAVQTERFKTDKGINTNSAMTPRLIKKHCELDAEGGHFLEHSMGEMNFSARAHDRILKVARTLADLGGLDKISADNVLEAVQYRTLDRKLWV